MRDLLGGVVIKSLDDRSSAISDALPDYDWADDVITAELFRNFKAAAKVTFSDMLKTAVSDIMAKCELRISHSVGKKWRFLFAPYDTAYGGDYVCLEPLDNVLQRIDALHGSSKAIVELADLLEKHMKRLRIEATKAEE